MISAKGVTFEEEGSGLIFESYKYYTDNFNKLNLGALVGFGVEVNELYYLELEYNPYLIPIYNEKDVKIKSNYWGLKLGLNINKLF